MTKAELIQIIYKALPNGPTHCDKFDVDSDDEAVRFEWWGVKLRVNALTYMTNEVAPDGVRIITRVSMLAEKLIMDEWRKDAAYV